MKSKWLSAFLAMFGLLISLSIAFAQGDEHTCDMVYLFNAWARPSPAGAPHGAVFGLLVNLGSERDTLVRASSDVAQAVELHETIMGEHDVMQMRPVEGGFVIRPNGYLELQPGGLHIMLINLKQPLVAGDTLDLTLDFEHAGEIQVAVPIRDMTEMETEGEAPMPSNELIMPWDEACAKVHVVDAWVRPTAAGMPNSAAYALLLNLTDTNEVLIGASSDVAEAVELHEMVMGDNDVMQMRPVEQGIVVPAGGAVILKPGGLHIMLIGLTGELKAGEMIDMSLTFAENRVMPLTIPVREPEEGGMTVGGMQHSNVEGGS